MLSNCPNCSTAIDDDAVFCVTCAKPILQKINCPNCDGLVPARAKFCKYCAFELLKSREVVQEPLSPVLPTPSTPLQPISSPFLTDNKTASEQSHPHLLSQSAASITKFNPHETENYPNKPTSYISPAGAAFAVICFFLPWIKVSQCGITKTVSGAEAAGFDNSFWIFPLMGIISIAAYFIAKNQNQIWKARPYIFTSSIFALFLLFYKYYSIPSAPEIMGQRITAADLGITLGLGSYGTIIGFVAAIVGCSLINRNNNVTPAPDSKTHPHSVSFINDVHIASNSLKPNVAAALCYILPLTLQFVILFLGFEGVALFVGTIASAFAVQILVINLESYKRIPLVRFHAYQSILLTSSYYLFSLLIAGLVLIAFNQSLSTYDLIGNLQSIQFVMLLLTGFLLAYLGLTVFISHKAYKNTMHKLPYIGDWAMQRLIIQPENNVLLPSSAPINQFISILQTTSPISPAESLVIEKSLYNESENPNQTAPPQTSEFISLENPSVETYITDSGNLLQKKMMLGVGFGVSALIIAGFLIATPNSNKEEATNNTFPLNYSNSYYDSNNYSESTSNSEYSANSIMNSSEQYTNSSIDEPNVIGNSVSENKNSSSSSSTSKKGILVTDSNIRDSPNKDAFSLGIHFKDAKVEVLDETSYEIESKVSTWYKVRITEYGCSKDPTIGCGKNSVNDSNEGWVNAKNVLVTTALRSPSSEEKMSGQQLPPASNYSVRIYNIDDLASVYVNDSKVSDTRFNQTERLDITTWLQPGKNEIRFVLQNSKNGFTYGFEVYKDNKSIFKDECGNVGSSGCKGSSKLGTVYNQMITVNTTEQ